MPKKLQPKAPQKVVSSNHLMFKEWGFYIKTGIFGMIVFGLIWSYLKWLNIPGELNKAMADTAVVLMGFSMLLSSICYFWNFLDWAISYRKYLGLIGFAFSIAHLLLSWEEVESLLKFWAWEGSPNWPFICGGVAFAIFLLMALVSNSAAARMLGALTWKRILRAGYIAVLLVTAHVYLLKSGRWLTWFNGGMKTLPSMSLLITIFMIIVVGMRVLLWWVLKQKAQKAMR